VNAGYGQQLADDKPKIAGSAFARYRLFATTMSTRRSRPVGARSNATLRRFATASMASVARALSHRHYPGVVGCVRWFRLR